MNLQKLFLYVKTAEHDSFIAKYFENGHTNTQYETDIINKIVFLEKTKQIIVKGEIYGADILNASDVTTCTDEDKVVLISEGNIKLITVSDFKTTINNN